MEVCPKLPVETCGTGDWYINQIHRTSDPQLAVPENFDITNRHKAGTTAQPAAPNYQQELVGLLSSRNSNY